MEIKSGNCYALFAFDVAVAIDLDRTQRIVATERAALRHKRRAPRYFDYQPAPLRVSEETTPLMLGAIETRSNVDLVLYDFGAVSVAYSIPLIGPFDFLLDLSETLYANAELLADARRRVERLLQVIGAAVDRQSIAEFVEDYVIFEIESFGELVDVKGFYLSRAQQLAQILRAERGELSEEEVSDAISHRISFGPGDLAIIDWHASILFDANGDDVRAVLEFANVELVEMRYLDSRLDQALGRAYESLTRSYKRFIKVLRPSTDLENIGQLQVDGAILFEGVNNALKLLGDQYLARVYRLVSQRFHLAEWDSSILRNLDTLESIYEKMADRLAAVRMEVLEWIIILLIFIEIVLSLGSCT
ncbi:MAG: hypothetical protein USCGTAYLOR_00913 [Chromatiales bacterium USCg_Taylor]|nr:MAG: hypothetical protein USCGTAYLOR_00913 [Chromatiales bacterium USCg_Taylor]